MDTLAQRFEPNRLIVERATGPWLHTTDGRTYVDYLLGNCTHLLGHSHPRVVERLREQVERCTNVGDGEHAIAGRVARHILGHAHKDALRFVNTGSEAVHLAIRLARAHTGRPLALKFEGHYHGWFSEQIAHFVPDGSTTGLPPRAGAAMLCVPWNDVEALETAFEQHGEQLALVMCEPVLCHAGPVPPEPGFLGRLRALCDRHGALLLFDECITGFRLELGGGQARYGVQADLVTYSKTLGAGLPIGVCCGSETVMRQLGPDGVYQAGTYDANPLSLAAADVVLSVLQQEPVHARIASYTSLLANGIEQLLKARSLPHVIHAVPGILQFYLTDEPRLIDYRMVMERTDTAFYGRLVDQLREEGIHLIKGDLRSNPRRSWLSQWFVSAAHDRAALDRTLEALEAALARTLDRSRPSEAIT